LKSMLARHVCFELSSPWFSTKLGGDSKTELWLVFALQFLTQCTEYCNPDESTPGGARFPRRQLCPHRLHEVRIAVSAFNLPQLQKTLSFTQSFCLPSQGFSQSAVALWYVHLSYHPFISSCMQSPYTNRNFKSTSNFLNSNLEPHTPIFANSNSQALPNLT
jgi:hypothetical protein